MKVKTDWFLSLCVCVFCLDQPASHIWRAKKTHGSQICTQYEMKITLWLSELVNGTAGISKRGQGDSPDSPDGALPESVEFVSPIHVGKRLRPMFGDGSPISKGNKSNKCSGLGAGIKGNWTSHLRALALTSQVAVAWSSPLETQHLMHCLVEKLLLYIAINCKYKLLPKPL